MNNYIKFKTINCDLELLKKDCRRINNRIIKQFKDKDIDAHVIKYSGKEAYHSILADQLSKAPMTSRLHDFYNVFTFPYEEISNVYYEICNFFKEVCPYNEKYCMHAWLNYQYKGESIPWHYHWKGLSGLDKTFICTYTINTEPSKTTYKFPNDNIVIINNKNNNISLYEDIGDIHMVDEWTEDEPRISISMDFVPMKYVQGSKFLMNTWLPVI